MAPFGIPIHVDRSWFVIVAFLAWSLASGHFPARYPGLPLWSYWAIGSIAALLLFGCVLLHELGHSLVAKAHGIPVLRVVLFLFGGVAQLGRDPARPLIELLIALAGPLVSAAIAWACFAAAGAIAIDGPVQLALVAMLRYLSFMNLALLLFNLLPGFPLDGGRVLRAAIWTATGSLRKATRIVSVIGSGFGWLLVGFGVWLLVRGWWGNGLWYIVLGAFLRRAALMSVPPRGAD